MGSVRKKEAESESEKPWYKGTLWVSAARVGPYGNGSSPGTKASLQSRMLCPLPVGPIAAYARSVPDMAYRAHREIVPYARSVPDIA
eukprot:561664-Rhodomonas_salina.2